MSKMRQHEMTREKALQLLALSCQIEWSFPTSQGPPVRDDGEDRIQQVLQKKQSFVEAARFLLENGEDDMSAELAANAWRLWLLSGKDIEQGRQFLAQVLDKNVGKISRARSLALYGDGLLAYRRGKLEESDKRNQEALNIAEKVRDKEARGLAHLGLSRISFEEEGYEEARLHAVKARELLSGLTPAFGQAPLFLHASSVRMLGDYDQASSLFKQSVELNRRLDDVGMVTAELYNLGRVEIHRGNVDAADQCFDEAEKLAGPLEGYDLAMSLFNKAAVAFLKGDHSRAQSLLTRSKTTLKESGINPIPDDKFDFDWLTGKLEEANRTRRITVPGARLE